MGNGSLHRGRIKLAPGKRRAVLHKSGRDLVAESAEDDRDRCLEQRAVRPHRIGLRQALVALRKQCWLRKASFQFPDDQLAVAVYVCTDLHHRNTAVTAGQRHKLRLGHDDRLIDGSPGQLLDAKADPHFL